MCKVITNKQINVKQFKQARNLAAYQMLNYNQIYHDELRLDFVTLDKNVINVKDVNEPLFELTKYVENDAGFKINNRKLVEFNLNDSTDFKFKLSPQAHILVNQIEVIINLLLNDTEKLNEMYQQFEQMQSQFNKRLKIDYQKFQLCLTPEMIKDNYAFRIKLANDNNILGNVELVQNQDSYVRIIAINNSLNQLKIKTVINGTDVTIIDAIKAIK